MIAAARWRTFVALAAARDIDSSQKKKGEPCGSPLMLSEAWISYRLEAPQSVRRPYPSSVVQRP